MADLPVLSFIQERLAEADSTLETRQGTAFYDLFVKPQEFMLQPFITAMETVLTAQSVSRVLALSDPDQFDTSLVDDLVSNVYITRDQGAFATTVVRVLYQTAVDREYAAFTAQFDSNGLSFFNKEDVTITAAQMELQTSGNFFYLDFPVQAQFQGTDYNLDVTQGVSFINDSAAVTSSFLAPAEGGLAIETNTEVLNRAQNSIGVRDLETIKGINAIIQENFTYISEIQAIGMGDAEMQRDILYNAHVGGKTDIYLKTPQFQTKTTNFVGVEYDFTREVANNIHMQMTATSFADPAADLGTPNIVTETVEVLQDIIPTAASVISAHIPSSYPVALGTSGAIVNGSTTVTVGSTANIITGLTVTGTGIPVGTIIAAVPNSTTFTLSNAATTTGTFPLNLTGTGAGINLNLGQWINLQVDNIPTTNIKIAGANPTQTQRFEIINSINAAIGLTVASEYGTDQIALVSPTVGQGSQLVFSLPTTPRTDGTTTLFPTITVPQTVQGIAPFVYTENFDFQVDYTNGKIIRIPGGAILSGSVVAEHPGTPDAGAGAVTIGSDIFTTALTGGFINVQPGDLLDITASTGVTTGTYVVRQKIDNQTLRILGLSPFGGDSGVQYQIISQQVVVVNYKYNPISVDVGPNVLLSDGVNRGIRPGRENFTIKDVAFIDLISIQEIDPVTGQGLGIFLEGPGGFGSGGFGMGGFGMGDAGDYNFFVNVPTARFSAFEDSVIVFKPKFFGQSFAITYYTATEIASIHTFCRSDNERVTGADVLPKTFIPGLVDMTINVRPNATNVNTPSNASLVSTVSDYVNGVHADNPLEESVIAQLIVDAGLASVQTPFTMTATVLNPDGSTTVLESVDQLSFPDVTLPSQTDNFTTSRIVHWYPRNIVITGV